MQVKKYDVAYQTIDTNLKSNFEVSQFLASYKTNMDAAMNEVLVYNAAPLSKAQPVSTLGNFVADAQLKYAQKLDAKTVGAVINFGGIRVPYISPGVITKGKVYELMPFDNKLTIVELPGKVLRQLCHHIAAYGGWPIAGITFEIRQKQAENILINGSPVNDQYIYLVSMSDYLVNGGDNCDFLKTCKRKDYNVFVRDILIVTLQEINEKSDSLKIVLDKRIQYAE